MNASGSPEPAGTPECYARLREDLYAFLGQYDLPLDRPIEDDTSLIVAGVLDSLALFNLVLWVEKQTGRPVDPATVDVAREWDTVRLILGFVDGFATRPARDVGAGIDRPRGGRTATLRIVEYVPAYREGIAGLQMPQWGAEADLNRQYMEWKYERNPYGSAPHIYLALDGDQVVGMRGFYPSCWEYGPEPRRRVIFVADDLMVREDHRNRGLVNHLMAAAYDGLHRRGIDTLINLSGGRFTVESSLATGWRSAGDLHPMERRSRASRWRDGLERTLSRTPLLWRIASSRTPATPAHAFSRLDRRRGPLVGKGGVAVRVSRRAMPAPMADLVRRCGHDGRIRHVRDETYFDWRFGNPLNDYRFFFVGEPELDGYLILKRTGPDPRVCVVDLEAVDDRTHDALVECVTRRDLFEEILLWSATLTRKSREVLSAAGFAPAVRGPALAMPKILVRPTDAARLTEDWSLDGMRLLDGANWDMRMIYSMAG